MKDEEIEKAFKEAQAKWVAANVDRVFSNQQQRYFFFSGSEFGLAAAREIYNETHVGPTDEDYLRG